MQQWIDEDPSHLAYYNQLKQVWDTSRQLAVSSKADEHKAWQRFQSRIHNKKDEDDDKELPVPKPYLTGWKVAASIILAIGLTSLTWWLLAPEKPQAMSVQTALDTKEATLPDGSVVSLNKSSSVTYFSSSKEKTRDVHLSGEAFFNVTPDKDKPFIVTTGNIVVKVVGTSFNIKESNGNTEVIVETGVVQVTRGDKTLELKANEKVVAPDTAALLIKGYVQGKLHNYFRSKQFVCDNTPLWKLVEVLNEAYNTNIVIGREELRTLPLNTTFYNESLDRILEIITETFYTYNLKVVREGDKIILQ